MGAGEGGPAETHVELAGCAWACMGCRRWKCARSGGASRVVATGVLIVVDNDDDDVGIAPVDLAVDLAVCDLEDGRPSLLHRG